MRSRAEEAELHLCLQQHCAILEEELVSLRQPLHAAMAAGATAGHPATSAAVPRGRARSLEAGYLVLRTPPALSHMRGIHHTTWRQLWERLGHNPDSSRKGFYVRLHESIEKSEGLWQTARLMLPIPVHHIAPQP